MKDPRERPGSRFFFSVDRAAQSGKYFGRRRRWFRFGVVEERNLRGDCPVGAGPWSVGEDPEQARNLGSCRLRSHPRCLGASDRGYAALCPRPADRTVRLRGGPRSREKGSHGGDRRTAERPGGSDLGHPAHRRAARYTERDRRWSPENRHQKIAKFEFRNSKLGKLL